MNNEPVGWIGYQEDRLVSFLQNFQQINQFLDATNPTGKVVPLYTHPVKELTDEEILREAYYILMREQQRKAQEK